MINFSQLFLTILQLSAERKSISSKDEIRPLENTSPRALNQNIHSTENIQITEVTGRQDYNTDNKDMKHPDHKPVETDRSIPLDFYSSPGNSKLMDRSNGRKALTYYHAEYTGKINSAVRDSVQFVNVALSWSVF